MVHSTGDIGLRQKDTLMDTDGERDHEYFFIVIFRDRAQCHRAHAYLVPHGEPGESIHKSVYAKVTNQVFICWQDLKLEA